MTALPTFLASLLDTRPADQQRVRRSAGPYWRNFPRPSWHGPKARRGGGAGGRRGGAGRAEAEPAKAAGGGWRGAAELRDGTEPGARWVRGRGRGRALASVSRGGGAQGARSPAPSPGAALRGSSRFFSASRRPPARIIPALPWGSPLSAAAPFFSRPRRGQRRGALGSRSSPARAELS